MQRNLAVPSTIVFVLWVVASPPPTFAVEPGFDAVQVRGTHNTYHLDRRPSELLDNFNIWAVEIDFGIKSGVWRVGHDDVEPKFGLDLLSEWLDDIAACDAQHAHPIFVKLEAKNPTEHCNSWPLWNLCTTPCCGWGWEEWYNWPPNWSQAAIAPLIRAAFGTEAGGLFTPAELASWQLANSSSGWPPMSYIRDNGPFVVYLWDNQEPTQVAVDRSTYFDEEFPGLRSEIEVNNNAAFSLRQRTGANILYLDSAYADEWAYIFMYPAEPTWVLEGAATGNLGTAVAPFTSIGFAVNAAQTALGDPLDTSVIVSGGPYNEKLLIDVPMAIQSLGGTVQIGGQNVAYTVSLRISDIDDAETPNPVFVVVNGAAEYTAEWTVSAEGGERACAYRVQFLDQDVGDPQTVTIRVGGSNGVRIDDVVVDDAYAGRTSAVVDGWVSGGNPNPRTFVLR